MNLNFRAILEFLIEEGAQLDSRNEYGYTPIHIAVQNGYLDLIRLFVNKGADVDLPNNIGSTPLHTAILNKSLEVVKLLLECNADINGLNMDCLTPLYMATRKDIPDIVFVLLKSGADTDLADESGWRPFDVAVQERRIEIVKIFIEHKIDVNRSLLMWKPIHRAASWKDSELIRSLIKGGANINTANRDGETPLFLALQYGNLESMKCLLGMNADVYRMYPKGTIVDLSMQLELHEFTDALKCAYNREWNIKNHHLFPLETRRAIAAVMKIFKRDKTQLGRLPKDIILQIPKFMTPKYY